MASFVLPTAHRVVQTGSLSYQWVPLTGWIPAVSVQSCRTLVQLEDTVGNFELRVGYQVATTTTKSPGTWWGPGSARSTDDKYVEDISFSTNLDDHMWVRFGVSCRLTSAGYGQSEVHLSISGSDP